MMQDDILQYKTTNNKEMEELINIQNELKAPKNLYNTFGKYHYRNAEGIMEAVKPLLKKYNCYLTLCDDIHMIGERYYLRATATIINKDGKSVVVTALAREDESKKGLDGAQLTGSTSSYARKYALNGLFLIDDTKDADTDEYKAEADSRAKREKIDAENQRAALAQKFPDVFAAKTKDELMVVFNNHADLQGDSEFMLAMSTRKKEVVK